MQWNEEKWQPGMQIRLIHNPLRIGMLTDAKPLVRKDRRLFQIRFPDIVERVCEDQLEPLPEERMNPLDLLAEEKLGTPKELRRTLTHVRLTGRLADIIYSMEATNTDFYAYQFKPVLKLLQTPTNGLLIADEVGLGKTIEAGLIWTELRSRFNLKRLLILCPAALREKWRDELVNKIGLSPIICDAKETLRILKDDQAHARGFSIISSTQGLRPPRGWEDAEDKTSNAAELARFLQAMESEERIVDLLVIDEAHHMRNPEAQTNHLGQLMRGVSEYLVLLTATPIHNYNRDLFSLLHLLDPDTFGRHEDFIEILSANAPLVRARDLVLKGIATVDKLTSTLNEAKASSLLHGNRQLETLLSGISEETLGSFSERSQIAYRLETINLLGHAITRTRKRDVKEWRVVRNPQPEFIPMTGMEREFYDVVTNIVIDYSLERDINEAFLLVTPQRQMASCMPAALKSWRERRIEIPEDQLSWTEQDDRRRQQLGPLTTELVDRSDEFVSLDELSASDSKYARLREMLQEFFNLHPKDKVIVFSTFRGTLAYLADRLDDDGISSIVLQGGGRRTKDDIIQEFRSPEGPSVMLSSEVGGEGVDLQFSWVVINYDLPWNPMRVEQRIGRVDRLGQESDMVLIWNLFYDDTVDARIYDRLYDKLDLCRNALGDFEAILGEEVKKLTRDLLSGHLTPEQQEERIIQTAQALETLKREEEHLESEAAHLVAYGDYILQQVQAARDMNRWINGADLFAYVIDFLNIHYPGYRLKETDGENHEYELSLTAQAKHDLSEFVRQKNLIGQTKLTQSATTPVVCRFENRVLAGARTSKETISQFHPLVRFISTRISETAAQVRPAVSVKLSIQDMEPPLAPGVYVLAVSLWSVQGLRDVEKLVYEAVIVDEPDTLLGEDNAERLASACASKGKLWLEVKHTCDLRLTHEIANEYLFGTLDDRFKRFVEEESAQNEDRADIQERNLERHVSKQKETILRTIEKLRASGRTKLIPANEGRLRALNERSERQKLAINSRRNVTARSEEICVAVAQIK
ncbi:MAG: DEAD/DEAH box helicase [Gammaproteobacteria bacterium]|nr:DEAD/DEAH box helicase [Gammaproteobacteria bacterium]MYH85788.1 DEAD/DEAH box helicase [Gammaproteobacteria bacterium]MYK05300.1 DEAD/DEAH box helicase [Gammaproteobacteria bacterium]